METYLFTSSKFDGVVELHYGDDGNFDGMEINGNLSLEQRYWLLRNTAVHVSHFKKILEGNKTAKLTKLPDNAEVVTFGLFWECYDDKVRSSRKRTLAKWQKMKKHDQQKAYLYIAKYLQSIPNGCEKKYAETYLNAELWNN